MQCYIKYLCLCYVFTTAGSCAPFAIRNKYTSTLIFELICGEMSKYLNY